MAKLKSLIKIEGTLDDLTFYKGKEGYLVRTKGGVSASRIKNDPAFARTRENGSEFGHSATSGKQLRRAIINVLTDAKDAGVTARLTQVMSRVKNADTTSMRGERKVSIGLTTPEGKLALNGFDFNKNAILSSVLLIDFTLTPATGEVVISDFTPNQNLGYPEGTTHVSLTAGFLNLDFITDTKDMQLSPVVNLPINGMTTTVTLTPPAVPSGTGNAFYFLKVAFFQEVNSIQYALNNGAYNALQLIDLL
jgi:hypothetical protein